MAYTSISDRTRYERISSLFSDSFNHFHRCHGSGTRSIKDGQMHTCTYRT